METLAVEAIRASQSATSAQAAAVRRTADLSAVSSPDPAAVAKFEAAMAANAPAAVSQSAAVSRSAAVSQSAAVSRSADSSAASIPFASQVSAAWRSAQVNNQGMLHRIRALSELRNRHSLSAAEMVELQYEVMNLSFQQEVVTKVADKTSNAVQTLIKNQ